MWQSGVISKVKVGGIYDIDVQSGETFQNQADVRPRRNESIQFDVLIVGSGPAGATAAYFLGSKGLRVALIDKKTFPRPKPCTNYRIWEKNLIHYPRILILIHILLKISQQGGDAWCAPALDILEEMGILPKMEKDGIVKSVTRGGFISPFGYKVRYIYATSLTILSRHTVHGSALIPMDWLTVQ